MNFNPILETKTLPHFAGPLSYGSDGAAAIDLRMPEALKLWPGSEHLVKTGLCIDMSYYGNMAAIVIPRSGLGSRGLEIRNTVGLIDSDYQGEIMVKLFNNNTMQINRKPGTSDSSCFDFDIGDRFCQLFFVPIITPTFMNVPEFKAWTERGDGGFGSTGAS